MSTTLTYHDPRLRGYFRRRGLNRWEGDIRIAVFGWWLRFYAGTSNFPRPKIHHWRGYGQQGLALRRSSKFPGRKGRRVFGVQCRHAR